MKTKLTKTVVDKIPFSTKQQFYWDTEMAGFGLCVGSASKTYVAQKDINGKAVRYVIGKHGVYTPETARKQAQVILVQMSQGINPNEAKAKAKIRGITLIQLFDSYIKNNEHSWVPATKVNYQDFMDNQFSDWKSKPIIDITTEMIIQKHRAVTVDSGPHAANSSLQFLRALYNFASIDDDNIRNPVAILSKKKQWNEIKRRQSIIREHELPAWYKAVLNLQNETMRDALRILLFTGMRKMEVFKLRWEHIDLTGRTLHVPKTKNGTSLDLPLSDVVYQIFKNRKENAGDSPWVFPGAGKEGHITEPKKIVKQVIAESGVKFILHDLRRTFITIANRLNFSGYTLKHLLNHTSNDVTAGYIVKDCHQLRDPVQRISDEILKLAGQPKIERSSGGIPMEVIWKNRFLPQPLLAPNYTPELGQF